MNQLYYPREITNGFLTVPPVSYIRDWRAWSNFCVLRRKIEKVITVHLPVYQLSSWEKNPKCSKSIDRRKTKTPTSVSQQIQNLAAQTVGGELVSHSNFEKNFVFAGKFLTNKPSKLELLCYLLTLPPGGSADFQIPNQDTRIQGIFQRLQGKIHLYYWTGKGSFVGAPMANRKIDIRYSIHTSKWAVTHDEKWCRIKSGGPHFWVGPNHLTRFSSHFDIQIAIDDGDRRRKGEEEEGG